MKSLILGASAGLGRALAEELAEHGHDLYLVASDKRDLDAIASDLRIRFGHQVFVGECDLRDFSAIDLREKVHGTLGQVDHVFAIAGYSCIERDFTELTEKETAELVQVNFLAPIRVVNAFLADLSAASAANCVGIGSVAATKARKKNTVYAASKRGLEFYFAGLASHFASTKCRVQFYRAGYIDTQMTFGQKPLFPKAKPRDLARLIRLNLGRDLPLNYLPFWWYWVMLIYRSLPNFILKRLSF